MDLFGAEPAPEPVPPAAGPRRGGTKRPQVPPAPSPSAPPKSRPITPTLAERDTGAIVGIAATPAEPLDRQLAPAQFRHPRANREIRLPGALVAYEFKRGKRRTIGFVVGADGLVVSAPKWVALGEVDAAVREKGRWIVAKLGEARERHSRLESTRIVWQDGAELPFLGETVVLVLDPTHGFKGIGAELHAEPLAGVPGVADGAVRRVLRVGLSQSAAPEQIRDAVQAWLMRQAKRIFTERMNHYAPLLGVQWRSLRLSSAGTRWGSASVDGSVRLNWRLIHFRLPIIDYVVAHELSHLRVMDHSPRFWDTVRTVVPDYAELRGQLKAVPIPKWD
ncbi:metal-dependent hydrolase [Rhodoferax koreense]|uniref:Metal-dependent hydrolase n=1 Tax=Rhodoferax koreensis TaxID=1842727 RepID=A0A1P8K4R4_9BURK|nr:metal-dependent hydrolase [Rhodoferax koreense]